MATKKKPSAKQIAARKKFAEMVRARAAARRKKNPAKAKPARAKNPARKAVPKRRTNPAPRAAASGFTHHVITPGSTVVLAGAKSLGAAKTIAQAMADAHGRRYGVVKA